MQSIHELVSQALSIRDRDPKTSIKMLEELDVLVPGHGSVFTNLATSYLLSLNSDYIRSGWVTAATLGDYGRFGNQILQYCAVRVLSIKCNLNISIPDWIGTHLFNLPSLDFKRKAEVATNDLIVKALKGELIVKNFDIGTYLPEDNLLLDHLDILKIDLSLKESLPFKHDLKKINYHESNNTVLHFRLGDYYKTMEERERQLKSHYERVHEICSERTEVWAVTDSPNELSAVFGKSMKRILDEEMTIPEMRWVYEWEMLRSAQERISITTSPPSTYFRTAELLS